MTKLLFMGLILTNKGIGPTEEKGKAVVNQRQENYRMPWKLEAS